MNITTQTTMEYFHHENMNRPLVFMIDEIRLDSWVGKKVSNDFKALLPKLNIDWSAVR